MSESLIELERVTLKFGDQVVLRDFDLTVEPGELLVVRGRSGSGKTTILSLLGGWLQPDLGRVVYAPNLTAARVALMPQVFGLMAELSILENVMLPLRLQGVAWREAAFHGTTSLAVLGIDTLGARLPRECSNGEQQRAALARAIAEHPPVLLADEPSSHLDAATTARVIDALRDIRATSAIVIASHDDKVSAAADRVVTLTG